MKFIFFKFKTMSQFHFYCSLSLWHSLSIRPFRVCDNNIAFYQRGLCYLPLTQPTQAFMNSSLLGLPSWFKVYQIFLICQSYFTLRTSVPTVRSFCQRLVHLTVRFVSTHHGRVLHYRMDSCNGDCCGSRERGRQHKTINTGVDTTVDVSNDRHSRYRSIMICSHDIDRESNDFASNLGHVSLMAIRHVWFLWITQSCSLVDWFRGLIPILLTICYASRPSIEISYPIALRTPVSRPSSESYWLLEAKW